MLAPEETPLVIEDRVDVYGWLQIILRLRAGEILDLQHGAYRQAHHGRHAGRSLRKLPQEIVPERLWCLLHSECFASRGKACLGSREGNRGARQANSVKDSSFLNS